jgi:hypothetical protein
MLFFAGSEYNSVANHLEPILRVTFKFTTTTPAFFKVAHFNIFRKRARLVGRAALKLRATPQLDVLRTGLLFLKTDPDIYTYLRPRNLQKILYLKGRGKSKPLITSGRVKKL